MSGNEVSEIYHIISLHKKKIKGTFSTVQIIAVHSTIASQSMFKISTFFSKQTLSLSSHVIAYFAKIIANRWNAKLRTSW